MRIVAVFALTACLAGCAQVFEGNMFQGVDPPPPLTVSSMASASLTDIKSQLADPNTASSFYTQLQDNPNALTALQTNLTAQIASAATPAAAVDAAQTLVLVTAYGSDAGGVVNDAIKQVSNLQSGGTPADAITALMAGKSQAEITAELTQFANMQTAFAAMALAAQVSNVVDSTIFYGSASASTQGDLAQIALVTAAAAALIVDNTDIATAAGRLFTGVGLVSGGAEMTKVTNALNTPQDPDTNPYAYLSAATSFVPS